MNSSNLKTQSTIKDRLAVYSLLREIDSSLNYFETIENLESETDFYIDNVRFIADSVIDETLEDELKSDLYVLGCFNASFLCDYCGLSINAIEALQKAEAFEALGEIILEAGQTLELAQDYARLDGYGHHFNGYDFDEQELSYNGEWWHVFDNR